MKTRRRLLEKTGQRRIDVYKITQLAEINSKLGAILLILTKIIGEEK